MTNQTYKCSICKREFLNITELFYDFHNHKIQKFKDIHNGERCFVLGTGPSLNKTNLDLIKNEIIFGVNTLYTGLERFGLTCDYYCCGDGVIWNNHYENIKKLDTTLILNSWPASIHVKSLTESQMLQEEKLFIAREICPCPYSMLRDNGKFSKDISKGMFGGGNVITTMCSQIPFYMGFKEVYLLGVDCDYTGMHRFDGSVSDNLNGDGAGNNRWDRVFECYKIIRNAYENDGRKIINCTVGGKLEVLRREKLENII